MSHGVKLDGQLEDESSDVVVGEAELAERGGVLVVVQRVEAFEGGGEVGDTEALVEEVGSACANAGLYLLY